MCTMLLNTNILSVTINDACYFNSFGNYFSQINP